MTWAEFGVLALFLFGVPIIAGVAYVAGAGGRKRLPKPTAHERRIVAGHNLFVVIAVTLPFAVSAAIAVLIHGIIGIAIGGVCAVLYWLFGLKPKIGRAHV